MPACGRLNTDVEAGGVLVMSSALSVEPKSGPCLKKYLFVALSMLTRREHTWSEFSAFVQRNPSNDSCVSIDIRGHDVVLISSTASA